MEEPREPGTGEEIIEIVEEDIAKDVERGTAKGVEKDILEIVEVTD